MTEDKRELAQEVAERQDQISKHRAEICRLEKELDEQLAQKQLHIKYKDEIIRDMRRDMVEMVKNAKPSLTVCVSA